ncbi:MAG: cation diffusion facilitator family transporter [Vicinamibacterales bacterium]|nr:cation diffusion facilitator family transporter [Vicinamibacterales bacterium]
MTDTHVHAHAYDRAFKVGIAVNGLYVLIEAGCGFAFNSVALISDAGHNMSDVLALGLAWGATFLSHSRPTERRTYGMKRATVLASLVSAVMLCVALGAVIWESLARLAEPASTNGRTIILVAGAGVIINLVTAIMFMSGRHHDLNIKSAFLHMAADAAVSLGVVVAGLIIVSTGWLWVDPIVALAVAAIIFISGLGLLRESLDLAMDAVPDHVDVGAVRAYLDGLPGVDDVHHLHIWAMSTTETALTVHLVMQSAQADDELLQSVSDTLERRFGIQHPTIQIEDGNSKTRCVYTPATTAS